MTFVPFTAILCDYKVDVADSLSEIGNIMPDGQLYTFVTMRVGKVV